MHERKITKPKPERELQLKTVDVFWLLDMDRTLLNSDALSPVLYDLFQLSPIEAAKAQQMVDDNHGNSFDTFGYLHKNHGDRIASCTELETGGYVYETLVDTILQKVAIETLRKVLLLPGAQELVGALDERGLPYGVLTTGDQVFQSFKLALLRRLLERPELKAKIVHPDDVADKTALISSEYWDESRQVFVLPEDFTDTQTHARGVVIVDDKTENLQTEHDNIHAVHIGTHDLIDIASRVKTDEPILGGH